MNTTWIALLVLEDILFLGVIFGFLSIRQRAYTILAGILFAVLLLTSLLAILGYINLLLVFLPVLTGLILGIVARVFLPRPPAPFGARAARIILVLYLILVVFVLALSVGMVLAVRK